jgi:hypothetical protein
VSKVSENEIIKQLGRIDTPAISNVVAAYPDLDLCLKLYDAWSGQYYTDTTMRCMYPDLGPRVGYAATGEEDGSLHQKMDKILAGGGYDSRETFFFLNTQRF